MKLIYESSYDELKNELASAGLKTFAADQVFQWIYGKNIQDINEWSNISKPNREILSNLFDTRLITVLNTSTDTHNTKKLLFELEDKNKIEGVIIPEKHHYTFCISTQVGCPLKCGFCATGALGFKRNLTTGEIINEVLLLKKELPDYTGKINIVLMGMGEPLLNYPNLKKALEIITGEKGMGISPRRVTLSTAGILEQLKKFEKDFPNIKISFSLNASDSRMREELMPITKTEKLESILDYFRTTKMHRKHRVTFEYVLLKGVNDSIGDAKKILNLVRGIPCKINVIPYNENKQLGFRTPSEETVVAFSDFLFSKGHTVIVRWSKGKGIRSACGQLAGEE